MTNEGLLIPEEIVELNKAVKDFCKFYKALCGFLIDLKALGNPEVEALFTKYQVKVEYDCNNHH